MRRILKELGRRARPKWRLALLVVGLAIVLWLGSLSGSWAMPLDRPFSHDGTITIPGTIPGCVVGQVTAGGAQPGGGTIPVLCQPYTIYVEVCGQTIPGCTIPPCTIPVAADAYGQFTVCGLDPGTYTMRVRSLNTLANLRSDIVVPEGSGTIPGTVPVDFGTLTPGDASGDNEIEILDFSILATAYDKRSGDPGWDPRANFDCSSQIEILDYSLLATYYGRLGQACP